ncbi:OXA-85 family oxacillin-hydrolyzing class D beta-lactamase [uncultured Fusobacterium sp.]|uniref:OXA-85 family oxacillin-hydrolyzing class D beta-lactamase n=1 Tax=uncultured Fusobacterium sp. TaxID=159267 RepID=UPI0025D009DB|nr:OXA-85 family oxacillin-hydrolyzing class D beta-lactamase [uncultured Fusobacterium sp.]
MKKFILVMLLFMFSIISFGNENQFMKEIFERKGLNGTFVVYDLKNDKIDYYNLDRANERFYPASSFKIFNTLIGLENGIVKNVDEMFYYYDGSKVFLDSWAKDSNLRYAIKVSQVPAYKKLARELGKERMQEGLNKLNYGNKEIGSEIDKFWLEGPLKISAMEQVKLLNLLSQSKLPFKLENQEQVKDITILEKKDDFILHGKTGWATDNIVVPIGWFVGWIKTSDNIYSFAINLDISDSKFLPKREEIVREYFKNINVIK